MFKKLVKLFITDRCDCDEFSINIILLKSIFTLRLKTDVHYANDGLKYCGIMSIYFYIRNGKQLHYLIFLQLH